MKFSTKNSAAEDDTILSDSVYLRGEGSQVTEWDVLVGNIIRIFETNHVDAIILATTLEIGIVL